MAGSITQADREFLETWEHISPQNWGITRLDPRGEERPEVISGRRQFKLTTEERMISQDKIRDESLDPFLNGSFRPVIVPETVTITTNPNALSDEDIERILGASDVGFDEWLKTLDSAPTIGRMLEIAEKGDISLRRFRAIEARMAEVRGELRIDHKDPTLKNFLSPGSTPGADGPVVASGAGNPRRHSIGGGMSRDYRDN